MASAPAVKSRRLRSSGMRGAFANPSNTDHLHAPAGRGDLLARTRAEGLQANGERVAERPVGEALDGRATAHYAARAQLLGTHRAARRERGELPQIDDRVGDTVGRTEPALREPALERHLAAFVARGTVAARTRTPPLVPAAGGLAMTGSRSTADPLPFPRGARRRTETTQVHLIPPPPPDGRRRAASRARWARPSGSRPGRPA